MKLANLDWTVSAEPLYLADGRKAPRVALVRNTDGNPILGTAGPSYTPIQNSEWFGILNAACEKHGVAIKTAGALGQGERVWMLADMHEAITVNAAGGEDNVKGYMLVDTAHDGSGAANFRFTPIRVVCQNTLGAATSENPAVIKVRHTKSAADRVKLAEQLVSGMAKAAKETGETFNELARKVLNVDQIRAYIESVFPTPKNAAEITEHLRAKRATVEQLVYEGKGSELSGRTAWGVYNAVTEYIDHVKPSEAKSQAAVLKAQTSALFGAGDELKSAALAEAVKLLRTA
jgi:phage/plasmid-like protein (TIGR03299 family)